MKLTKEVAEQFCRDQSVELGEFTEISDAAAQALAQHEDMLYLNGLTSLSQAAYDALVESDPDGERIRFDRDLDDLEIL